MSCDHVRKFGMGGVGGNLDPGSSGRFPKFPGILCRRKSNGTVRPDWKIPPEKRTTFSDGPHFPLFCRSRNFREFAVPFRELLVSTITPPSTSQQLATWWTCRSHATNVHSVCRDLPLLIQAFSKCTNALLFQKSVVLCNC